MDRTLVDRYLPPLRAARTANLEAFVGFDGFVDEIIHAVDKRHDPDRYDRVTSLEGLGQRIVAAAGRSANLELVAKQVKIGGNGPIMANALCALGLNVKYMGALGRSAIHPVFNPLAERARVWSISDPGHTDALEFDDGKLLLGKYAHLKDLNWDLICREVGADAFADILAPCQLVAMVNWTMCPGLSDIWRNLLARFRAAPPRRRALMMVDLADPEKRTPADIREAMQLVAGFEQWFDVVLGLNEKEGDEVAEVMAVRAHGEDDHERVARVAEGLQKAIGVGTVVVHPRTFAAAASAGDARAIVVDGPFTETPLISTGAGDHFNAGFATGRLLGLGNEGALVCGVLASGYYVRTAHSASLAELAEFLVAEAEA